MRKIAVTGGLSCGKSTVCLFLKKLGAYVVNADQIVHQLLSPDTNLGQKIVSLLGSDTVNNQKFDRTKIARKVFNNPNLLQSYENLIHPAVQNEIEKLYQQTKHTKKFALFVAEVPLLFEAGTDKYFDEVIVVSADPDRCKQRFSSKNEDKPGDYEQRIKRQLSLQEKIAHATYVIENNGSIEKLENDVKTLYDKLKNC